MSLQQVSVLCRLILIGKIWNQWLPGKKEIGLKTEDFSAGTGIMPAWAIKLRGLQLFKETSKWPDKTNQWAEWWLLYHNNPFLVSIQRRVSKSRTLAAARSTPWCGSSTMNRMNALGSGTAAAMATQTASRHNRTVSSYVSPRADEEDDDAGLVEENLLCTKYLSGKVQKTHLQEKYQPVFMNDFKAFNHSWVSSV